MTRFLFVYGTLMRRASASSLGRPERQRLQQETENLGTAMVCGRLYDLGRYPGLVAADKAADVVHGELLLLAEPAITFAWLDAYEGIDGAAIEAAEYERVEVDARRKDGTECRAWVYRCRRRPDERQRIASGLWWPHRSALSRVLAAARQNNRSRR